MHNNTNTNNNNNNNAPRRRCRSSSSSSPSPSSTSLGAPRSACSPSRDACLADYLIMYMYVYIYIYIYTSIYIYIQREREGQTYLVLFFMFIVCLLQSFLRSLFMRKWSSTLPDLFGSRQIRSLGRYSSQGDLATSSPTIISEEKQLAFLRIYCRRVEIQCRF